MAIRFSDTFTEASNTALGSHTPDTDVSSNGWTAQVGTWIADASDWARPSVTSGSRDIATMDTGDADGTLTVEGYVGASREIGIVFRWSDSNNFWWAGWQHGGSDFLRIVKVVGGSTTVVVSEALDFDNANTWHELTVNLDGNDIEVSFVNDSQGTPSAAQVISTTSSDLATNTAHGLLSTNTTSSRLDNFQFETTSFDPTVGGNGYDITATSTNTSTSNFDVKINGGSAVNPASVVRINATQVRLRMPDANRILATDTVTVSSTADSVTDESATNNSIQTSTAIKIPLKDGGNYEITFASAPTVGISRAGVFQYTDAVNITSATLTLGTGEEQFRGDVQLDPDIGDFAFGAAAVSFPYTPAENEALVCRVHLPETTTHATSTAFSVGDVIFENGVYYRIEDGDEGTSAGSKPTFSDTTPATVTDGSITWTAMEGRGYQLRSPIVKAAYAVCAGSSLKSQDLYAPAPWAGADKTWRDSADINTAVLPGDTISGATSVSDAEAIVSDMWYDLGTVESSPRIPGLQFPGYGRDISREWAKVTTAICSDASYKTVLIDLVIQRGIEQRGIREIGGYWSPNGGWSQGRISSAIYPAALLGNKSEWIAALKTNSNTGGVNWGGTEPANQVGYVNDADKGRTLDSKYQFGDNGVGGKVYLAPNTDPSTLTPQADSPANAYFPASVRNDWLHTPIWGIRHETEPERDTPLWNFNDAESSYYRRCCTAGYWGYLVYAINALGLTSEFDAPAFFDYVRRYEHIQGPSGANSNWENSNLWTLFEANEPAFSFTATAVESGGTWYIDLEFNRYATQTDANIESQFGCSGSITLSNADHTGPRTFRVEASADPTGETVTYTQSGTAANRVVDSGNNELPTGSTAVVSAASVTGHVLRGRTLRGRVLGVR